MQKQLDADKIKAATELAADRIEAAKEAEEEAEEEARQAGRAEDAARGEGGAANPTTPLRQQRKKPKTPKTKPDNQCTDFPGVGDAGCAHAGDKDAAGRCVECAEAWQCTETDAEPTPHLIVNFQAIGKALRFAQKNDHATLVDGNAGQIARTVLEACGFDLDWFSPSRPGPTARRALRTLTANGKQRPVVPPATRNQAHDMEVT